jgi:histone-arginine methyltransferase CARM1
MIARNLFLKEGGKMFPEVGTIYSCPFTDASLYDELLQRAAFWSSGNYYDLDLTCLYEQALEDNFSQAVVAIVDPSMLLSSEQCTHVIDFAHDSIESVHEFTIPLSFVVSKTAVFHGLCLWFDVSFPGTSSPVTLSTSPFAPPTHWHQCRIVFANPLGVSKGQVVTGSLHVVANKAYSYDMKLQMALKGSEGTSADGARIESVQVCHLKDQYYPQYPYSAPASSPTSN